jgi:peptide deformylase
MLCARRFGKLRNLLKPRRVSRSNLAVQAMMVAPEPTEGLMAIRTVLQLGDPGLREVCQPVEDPTSAETRKLVKDLADTLAFWRKTTGYGRAIAAPQIGKTVRVIFFQLPGAQPWPLVNPEITWRSDETIVVWDACLSFLSIFMKVRRNREIRVKYQDLRGQRHEIHAGDERDLSELLQHEIDHLDGVLALDRIVDIRTLCTREEFEKRYRASSPYATAGKRAGAGGSTRIKRQGKKNARMSRGSRNLRPGQ